MFTEDILQAKNSSGHGVLDYSTPSKVTNMVITFIFLYVIFSIIEANIFWFKKYMFLIRIQVLLTYSLIHIIDENIIKW